MFKITNDKVEVIKACVLSKRQAQKLKSLDQKAQYKYVLSLMGLSKDTVAGVNSGRWELDNTDRLATKNKNTILHQFHNLLDNSSDKFHKPMIRADDSNWIGVEIECLLSGRDESSECENCNGSGTEPCCNCDGDGELDIEDSNGNEYRVRCGECGGDGSRECGNCDGGGSSNGDSIHEKVREALRLAKITHCSVKSDGSLSGDDGMVGVEVTVLFDARHGFDKIHKVCKILNSLGAKVNDTCGLHVHMDQFKNSRTRSIAIGKQLGNFLPILSRLVPSSRRKNTYCKLAVSELDGCRYHAVNMTALKKHKTIEIRLHSGTTDGKKIEAWVKLLNKIVNCSARLRSPIATFQGLIDCLQLEADLVEYFDRRFQKFNPIQDERVTVSQPDTTDDEIHGIEQFTARLQSEIQNQAEVA